MTDTSTASRSLAYPVKAGKRRAVETRYRTVHREAVNAYYRAWYDANRARVAAQRKVRRERAKVAPRRGKRALWITGALLESMLTTGREIGPCSVLDGLPGDATLIATRLLTQGEGNLLELVFDSAAWIVQTGPIPRIDITIRQRTP